MTAEEWEKREGEGGGRAVESVERERGPGPVSRGDKNATVSPGIQVGGPILPAWLRELHTIPDDWEPGWMNQAGRSKRMIPSYPSGPQHSSTLFFPLRSPRPGALTPRRRLAPLCRRVRHGPARLGHRRHANSGGTNGQCGQINTVRVYYPNGHTDFETRRSCLIWVPTTGYYTIPPLILRSAMFSVIFFPRLTMEPASSNLERACAPPRGRACRGRGRDVRLPRLASPSTTLDTYMR